MKPWWRNNKDMSENHITSNENCPNQSEKIYQPLNGTLPKGKMELRCKQSSPILFTLRTTSFPTESSKGGII